MKISHANSLTSYYLSHSENKVVDLAVAKNNARTLRSGHAPLEVFHKVVIESVECITHVLKGEPRRSP